MSSEHMVTGGSTKCRDSSDITCHLPHHPQLTNTSVIREVYTYIDQGNLDKISDKISP